MAEAKSLVGVHTLGGRRAALQRSLLKSTGECHRHLRSAAQGLGSKP